jgi:predicted  nucleic acid-binding Zn-ribbon protein
VKENDMSDQVQAILKGTEDTKKLSAWIDEAIARLKRYLPIEAEYDRFKAETSKNSAVLQAQRAEIDENNKVIVSHNLHLQEVKRQIAHAKEELNVWLNDIGRASKDHEALSLEVERMKRRR